MEQAAEQEYTPEQIAEYQRAWAEYYAAGGTDPSGAEAAAAYDPSAYAQATDPAAMAAAAVAYYYPKGVSQNPLMKRPARKQAASLAKAAAIEGDRNMWWGYTIGDYSRKHASAIPAETRCNPARDTGYTKGSRHHPATALFCIHFAKGNCAKGEDCSFLHRIPEHGDELRWEVTKDVFGRDKHENERDDKSGTGSFVTGNRTLYVGHVPTSYKDVEATVRKHFAEFGELESVRVLTGKAVAFIRYKSRLNAEFAREAMVGQTLDGKSKGKEILNVRWANEDPNPRAQEMAKQNEYNKLVARMQAEVAQWGTAGMSPAMLAAYSAYSAENNYGLGGGEGVAPPPVNTLEAREPKRKFAEVEVAADEENPYETETAVVVTYEPAEKDLGGTYDPTQSSKRDPYVYPDTSHQYAAGAEAAPAAPAKTAPAAAAAREAPSAAGDEVAPPEPAAKKAKTAAAAAPEPTGGILSRDTLNAIAQNASKLAQRKRDEPAKKGGNALATIGGYESGEDDE